MKIAGSVALIGIALAIMSGVVTHSSNPEYISTNYPDDTANLYALLRRESDSYIYDVGSDAFEAVGTWNDARADECDIVLTNKSAGLFTGDFPLVSEDIIYNIQIYLRAGASPATTDSPIGPGMGINEPVLLHSPKRF